jgi:hypothetical protein
VAFGESGSQHHRLEPAQSPETRGGGHCLRKLWIRARRPLALGWSDERITVELGVPLATWLDCYRASDHRPVPVQELKHDLK